MKTNKKKELCIDILVDIAAGILIPHPGHRLVAGLPAGRWRIQLGWPASLRQEW